MGRIELPVARSSNPEARRCTVKKTCHMKRLWLMERQRVGIDEHPAQLLRPLIFCERSHV
jgi:hypothetical protein